MHATSFDPSNLAAMLEQLEADIELFKALDPFDPGFDNVFRSVTRRGTELEAYLVAEVARYDARIKQLAELAS